MKKFLLTLSICFASFVASAQVSRSNLVLHLPFDGNGNDISGKGNHATITNANGTTDRFGGNNGAMQFSNTTSATSYASVTSNDLIFTSSFTISAWFQYNQGSFMQPRIVDRDVDNGGFALMINSYNSTARKLLFRVGNGTVKEIIGTTTVTTGDWHHVVATFDSTTNLISLYLDGNLEGTATVSLGTASSNSLMGICYKAGTTNDGFGGMLDDLRIYTRLLSSTEISSLRVGSAMIPSLSKTAFCQGGRANMTITAPVDVFGAGNTFYAELSDTNGSFASPTRIGSFTSNTTCTFQVTIPANALPGTRYRVRAVGGTPTTVPSDSTIQISIAGTGNARLTQRGDTLVAPAAAAYQWYRYPNGIISGAVLQKYFVNQTGRYYCVTTSSAGCFANTDTVYLVKTSVKPVVTNSNTVSIYPNPATDYAIIEHNGTAQKIVLYDLFGRVLKVFSVPVGQQKSQIDLSGMRPGTVLVRIEGSNGIDKTMRLIIQ